MSKPIWVRRTYDTHPDFIKNARCKDLDPELFFPLKESEAEPVVRNACGYCPVRDECLSHALASGEEGIWGGTTTKQRRAIRRHQATPTKITP